MTASPWSLRRSRSRAATIASWTGSTGHMPLRRGSDRRWLAIGGSLVLASHLTRSGRRSPCRRRPARLGMPRDLADEEPLELAGCVVETLAAEAVVLEAALFGDRYQARGAEQGQVVLDRRLGQLEPLGDLGEVEILVAQQAQDPQTGLVAKRAVQPHDRLGWRERID